MKAARLLSPGILSIADIPKPEVKPNTALVKVMAAGICGTDLHIYRHGRADVSFPLVPGHELSGVVEEAGEGVTKLRAGSRVVLDPVISCGLCPSCRKGRGNICASVKCFGVQTDGGFQEYVVAGADRLHVIPDSLSYREAALAEPFSIAANILSRADARQGESAVILGAGTIGLSVLQVAKVMGCRALITDIEEEKLRLARAMGADLAICTGGGDLNEAVAAFFPGGADIVIDAIGISTFFEKSVELAAPGGRVVVISFDSKPAKIIPSHITRKELSVLGSRMSCGQFSKAVSLLGEGKLDLAAMISQVFPLERIQEAFEFTLSNSSHVVKTIIEF